MSTSMNHFRFYFFTFTFDRPFHVFCRLIREGLPRNFLITFQTYPTTPRNLLFLCTRVPTNGARRNKPRQCRPTRSRRNTCDGKFSNHRRNRYNFHPFIFKHRPICHQFPSGPICGCRRRNGRSGSRKENNAPRLFCPYFQQYYLVIASMRGYHRHLSAFGRSYVPIVFPGVQRRNFRLCSFTGNVQRCSFRTVPNLRNSVPCVPNRRGRRSIIVFHLTSAPPIRRHGNGFVQFLFSSTIRNSGYRFCNR